VVSAGPAAPCASPQADEHGRAFVVAVYGSGDPSPEVLTLARELGRGIAERGWVLKNGGYGGTMAAAARAAREAGGRVVGVTCRAFGRAGPNDYCNETLDTADLFERLRRLIEETDAFIALPGGTGTLTEVLLTWELMVKGLLPPRPLCLVGAAWQPWRELMAADAALVRHGHLLSWVAGAAEACASVGMPRPPAASGPDAHGAAGGDVVKQGIKGPARAV
jgi:uncharacterized protein (TIGR00730 family)